MNLENFWNKIKMIKAEVDRCWEWTGALLPGGYGQIHINGRTIRAHRLMFELFYGRKPTKQVLHKCDNPGCVNPLHLYEGGPEDNARDRAIRGDMRAVKLQQKFWKYGRTNMVSRTGGRGKYAALRKAFMEK